MQNPAAATEQFHVYRNSDAFALTDRPSNCVLGTHIPVHDSCNYILYLPIYVFWRNVLKIELIIEWNFPMLKVMKIN